MKNKFIVLICLLTLTLFASCDNSSNSSINTTSNTTNIATNNTTQIVTTIETPSTTTTTNESTTVTTGGIDSNDDIISGSGFGPLV